MHVAAPDPISVSELDGESMEAKYVCGATKQSVQAIAASTVVTRDRWIGRTPKPISASVARDPEIFLASPARRPENSSLRITTRTGCGTVVHHRRELRTARAQTRGHDNARTIAASIWTRASVSYASDAISPRAYAAPRASCSMRRFGYGTWRDPCRKDP